MINTNKDRNTVTKITLVEWFNSTSGRYIPVTLPRLKFLEGSK